MSIPANGESNPAAPKREAIALDFAAARKLLESCSDHWLAGFIVVDTACSARRGEMLALTWPDVIPGSRRRDSISITSVRLKVEQNQLVAGIA